MCYRHVARHSPAHALTNIREPIFQQGASMNRSRLALTAIGISLATRLSAQTAEPQQEVVIVGLEEQLPQQLEEFGTHVDTITRDQIRNGSYADVAQSLQALAPGFYVQPKNG